MEILGLKTAITEIKNSEDEKKPVDGNNSKLCTDENNQVYKRQVKRKYSNYNMKKKMEIQKRE